MEEFSSINLPTYDDDELKVFHPICELALKETLCRSDLGDIFEVKHHVYIGSICADFAVVRKTTGKYLLIIEVKRTPSAVTSSSSRSQVQFYVTEAGDRSENGYYALTNLEVTDLFKYSANRLSVLNQILEPSPLRAGDFRNNPSFCINNLIEVFKVIITIALNDNGEYRKSTTKLIPLLQSRKSDPNRWHTALMVIGYEYIRSVLLANRCRLNNWKVAILYRNRAERLMEKAREVNFDVLFSRPLPESNDSSIWDPQLLGELYDLGSKALNGNELAEIAHSIAIENREYEGLTPTDLELATTLLTLTKYLLKEELNGTDVICDPTAGSGNLLIGAISVFRDITPDQLWANDKEILFLEPLAIRLGLAFPTVISPKCTPKITGMDIADLSMENFTNCKIVVMNPPYISGVTDQQQKLLIAERIRAITGRVSKTNVGQVGLEALFVELVTEYVSNGTIIGVVLPKRILTAVGNEATETKRYLLDNFGLQIIFNYPRHGIFSKVMKDTVVFIGIKGENTNSIKVVKSVLLVTQIENKKLLDFLSGQNNHYYGVTVRNYKRDFLQQSVHETWRELILDGINELLGRIFDGSYLSINSIFDLKRGRVGNSGLSDLIFINSNKDIWSIFKDIVPDEWLIPGIRTADDCENVFISEHTTSVRALSPPRSAFINGTDEYYILENIIRRYLILQQRRKVKTRGQVKKEKNKQQIRDILYLETTHITKPETILIPRGARTVGRVFMVDKRAMVSTNFIEIKSSQRVRSFTLLTWLLSIFSHVQFEWLSNNQEGMRKLEMNCLKDKFLIPKIIEEVEDDSIIRYIDISKNTKFIVFANPQVQNNDIEWANLLFEEIDVDEKLRHTLELLETLVHERAP